MITSAVVNRQNYGLMCTWWPVSPVAWAVDDSKHTAEWHKMQQSRGVHLPLQQKHRGIWGWGLILPGATWKVHLGALKCYSSSRAEHSPVHVIRHSALFISAGQIGPNHPHARAEGRQRTYPTPHTYTHQHTCSPGQTDTATAFSTLFFKIKVSFSYTNRKQNWTVVVLCRYSYPPPTEGLSVLVVFFSSWCVGWLFQALLKMT